MGELSKAPNIGKALEQQLLKAGVCTLEELSRQGSKKVWLKLLQRDPSACINRLYALEGAVRGIRWHDLPEDVKKDLKAYYTSVKGGK